MAKLIIWVGGKPLIYGYKRHEFHWSEKHKCFIYLGTEFPEKEFNGVVDKAMTLHPDLHPKVKIVEYSEAAPIMAPPAQPDPVIPPPSGQREITVEEAEMVMERLAPDRLKKKAGRKAAPVLEVT